jgi:hypothetical protein
MTEMLRIDCPRAKSSTTPCYLRDGELAVGEKILGGREVKICIGCEFVAGLLREERQSALKKAKV